MAANYFSSTSSVAAPASTASSLFPGNNNKKLIIRKQQRRHLNQNYYYCYHGGRPSSSSTRGVMAAASNKDLQDESKQDRWKGLAFDTSDDQQDITRGKGLVDYLFQAPVGDGTHEAVLSSYDYISQGLRQFNIDNMMDGYYIAPAFMDKLVVHIAKNFMTLPNIKVPLILGIWGGKGQGKSFQCELVFAKMGINPIMMSAGELESGNAGEPAKLIRQRYREAADIIRKGKMCVLFINDLDAGAGRMGGTTQYTVNNQMVNATLMNIADNPTNVQLPGMYNKEENPRVPIIVTGNDFSTLYAPLIRDGRMEKFYWAPTREDRIGVCKGIFRTDKVADEDIVRLVDAFPGQSIDFFGALRARVYDDEVRRWVAEIGVENIGRRLVNSKEGPPTFQQPEMTLEKLMEYGHMLVAEQENVKRVQLADKYLSEAALGDANDDAIARGSFYGKAAQQVGVPVPQGCTDPNAGNFDPTARSDDGTCQRSKQTRRAEMAAAFSTVGAPASTPTSFLGKKLKKQVTAAVNYHGKSSSANRFKVMAKELDEGKQTDNDRWRGLAYDVSDDQQDITRGKGIVDSLFQAPMGDGTHEAVLSSYEYISQGLRQYNFDNTMGGFYIAPAFMDKLVVHLSKNFMTLPNIKVPLILGIWGGKGQGKSFQCELVFSKMGITPIMMSAGELESGNAGEPAKLIRQRYREAADIIRKGKMCCLFINDLDAGAGRMGGTTQYTVNNQMVNATLMNIADNPTNVQLPGMYNKEENPRVPIIVTGNDFSTLYAPLIRDGRMEKFYWAPTREDRIGVCKGIFRTDGVADEDVIKLVDTFPGQSIDFFGALRARVYDDEVRKWVTETGVENIGKKLVNSKEGPPKFEQPKMTIEKLLEYGHMLVAEQENVKRVQLADKYLSEAALGDANADAMKTGSFFNTL
ncbi:hypothetical protein U9M48_000166 [Paspalum notatum var. saurae]|uniref:Ribulose bisphosphate carboxylase/oxygenase activase, chloroplastic n=1 Tax=Paspalum notatum var. saurae TaxID=547442 RepID=A0AAQ3SH95_PASNO